MPPDYLHHHPQFADLIRIVAEEKGISAALVEKDYWIMHSLYGLQQLKYKFALKGGTSLSKGHGIISRFSEDIDILIEPPLGREVKTGRNQNKPAHIKTRTDFYDWLAQTIRIDGIEGVDRDTAFDDTPDYRSAGIRLRHRSVTEGMKGLRGGVLLEVGFDDVAPNVPRDISSWAYDYASSRIEIIDNRAKAVPCYDAGYSFVEKLQTVSTKFRKEQDGDGDPLEFMRHYYDVCELLRRPEVQKFLGTDAYTAHKQKRFRQGDHQNISENEAFLLSDPGTRARYAKAYADSAALYYSGKPTFEEILDEIGKWIGRL